LLFLVKNTGMETTTISQYELERGKPMPSKNHAIIQSRLIIAFAQLAGDRYTILSEITIDLPAGGVVPDIALYPPTPYEAFNDEVEMTTPPLCAIEIISPSQAISSLSKKPKITSRPEPVPAGSSTRFLGKFTFLIVRSIIRPFRQVGRNC
jgi:hypothetical protein